MEIIPVLEDSAGTKTLEIPKYYLLEKIENIITFHSTLKIENHKALTVCVYWRVHEKSV